MVRTCCTDNAPPAAHQLHVVDQGVAVLPGELRVAAEDRGLNVLGPVQLAQGGGKQQRRVVHQGRLRLQ